jgi:hypothetical protein
MSKNFFISLKKIFLRDPIHPIMSAKETPEIDPIGAGFWF